MNSETKTCQNCKQSFVIEPEDFQFYEKIDVPPPTFCPECRMIRRFLWRNEGRLFRRPETRTGEDVFSGFPKGRAKIWDMDYWNSDNWDPMDFGRDFDFSRPFFEQLMELLYSVPWPAKSVLRLVDSEYCDQVSDLKNCYLCFAGGPMEDSAYVSQGWGVKNSLDLYEARHTELSYDSYMVDDSYRAMYSINCEECTDVWFSKDLLGCSNCFGCIGLRKKSYYIFNQPFSKEDYRKYIAQFNFGSHKTILELKQKTREFWLKNPTKYALNIKCVNSTGEHIEHSKNLKKCYSVHESENLAYCQFVAPPATDSYDYTNWGSSISQMYESVTCGEECDRVRFCWECWPASRDLEYSMFCRSSQYLFGCVGLKKKSYCIFNKQYTKEEYFKLREKIIEHANGMPYVDKKGNVYKYGEFLPPEFSPFAYNETLAGTFLPLDKKEIEARGFLYREEEMREHTPTLESKDLPDDISEVKDDILKEILKCEDCSKAYRVIQIELQFYKHINLPLPKLCPDCRAKERFKFVNPPKFRRAKCQCAGTKSKNGIYSNLSVHPDHPANEVCPNNFETPYAPNRPEIIYCETCYNAEVA